MDRNSVPPKVDRSVERRQLSIVVERIGTAPPACCPCAAHAGGRLHCFRVLPQLARTRAILEGSMPHFQQSSRVKRRDESGDNRGTNRNTVQAEYCERAMHGPCVVKS